MPELAFSPILLQKKASKRVRLAFFSDFCSTNLLQKRGKAKKRAVLIPSRFSLQQA